MDDGCKTCVLCQQRPLVAAVSQCQWPSAVCVPLGPVKHTPFTRSGETWDGGASRVPTASGRQLCWDQLAQTHQVGEGDQLDLRQMWFQEAARGFTG